MAELSCLSVTTHRYMRRIYNQHDFEYLAVAFVEIVGSEATAKSVRAMVRIIVEDLGYKEPQHVFMEKWRHRCEIFCLNERSKERERRKTSKETAQSWLQEKFKQDAPPPPRQLGQSTAIEMLPAVIPLRPGKTPTTRQRSEEHIRLYALSVFQKRKRLNRATAEASYYYREAHRIIYQAFDFEEGIGLPSSGNRLQWLEENGLIEQFYQFLLDRFPLEALPLLRLL